MTFSTWHSGWLKKWVVSSFKKYCYVLNDKIVVNPPLYPTSFFVSKATLLIAPTFLLRALCCELTLTHVLNKCNGRMTGQDL